MSALELSVVVAYALLLLVLSVYGSHRYAMAYLYYRHKYRLPTPKARFERLPRVTIQLPIFNEMYVTERLIDAVSRIDYPRDLLEVQVLDDSTDETQGIARACVERYRATGLDIEYVHRDDRKGFKAGALEHGLTLAKGELVAVFDADFIPPAGLPAAHRPLLHRRGHRDGAGALGPPEPRLLARSPRCRRSCSTATSSSSTPRATAPAASSTSTARRACGAAKRSRTAAAGSTTRSPRTSTSRTAPR